MAEKTDFIPELKIIAHIHTEFPTKFGIPRQSGLVEELKGKIVFQPPYRYEEALRYGMRFALQLHEGDPETLRRYGRWQSRY